MKQRRSNHGPTLRELVVRDMSYIRDELNRASLLLTKIHPETSFQCKVQREVANIIETGMIVCRTMVNEIIEDDELNRGIKKRAGRPRDSAIQNLNDSADKVKPDSAKKSAGGMITKKGH